MKQNSKVDELKKNEKLDPFMARLIDAIKELEAQIDETNARIDKMKKNAKPKP